MTIGYWHIVSVKMHHSVDLCCFQDARGDQCDKCGKLINATELKVGWEGGRGRERGEKEGVGRGEGEARGRGGRQWSAS